MTATHPDGTSRDRATVDVLERLVARGPASRGTLGEEFDRSEASMSRVVRSLLGRGLVTEEVGPVTGSGRPRRIVRLVPRARCVIGIKVTADAVHGAACDLTGSLRATGHEGLHRGTEDRPLPVPGAVRSIVALVDVLRARMPRLDCVGIAVGGVVDDDGATVRRDVVLGWHDVDLAGLVEREAAVPVVLSNDVSALAHREAWWGTGRDHGTFGVITVGAGIGFALAREGRVVERLIDDGHLLRHAPVDTGAPTCRLGHRGCVAALLDRAEVERRLRAVGSTCDYPRALRDPDGPALVVRDDAARALGHLVATFAGALQTPRIALAGEDVEPVFAHPLVATTLADRIGAAGRVPTGIEVTASATGFTDWAHGAAVVALRHVLRASDTSLAVRDLA